MSESTTELSKQLVVGRKCDGRSVYDKDAKRELIEAYLRPGVSVARMGLQHGVNANLLRTWITRYRRQDDKAVVKVGARTAATLPAFVPIVAPRMSEVRSVFRLHARLANGVEVDVSELGGDELSSVLSLLSKLPCSDSTPG
jgi:transposase